MKVLGALRAVAAIATGMLAVVVLSSAADALMHGTGAFPAAGLPMADWQWATALAYRLCFAMAGGLVCAGLASTRPMAHAVILGLLGTCIGIIAAVVTWDLGPEFGPKWFQTLLAVTALPGCWLGARWLVTLRSRRARRL